MRGYFGIGILDCKTESNVGTLWRSAYLMGADFIFTIGHRYGEQRTDTLKSTKHIPLFQYDTFEEFYKAKPSNCSLVGIELMDKSIDLHKAHHPESCIYLLGAEDKGLSKEAIEKCDKIIKVSYPMEVSSLNVSTTGSLVMYDRYIKQIKE